MLGDIMRLSPSFSFFFFSFRLLLSFLGHGLAFKLVFGVIHGDEGVCYLGLLVIHLGV